MRVGGGLVRAGGGSHRYYNDSLSSVSGVKGRSRVLPVKYGVLGSSGSASWGLERA